MTTNCIIGPKAAKSLGCLFTIQQEAAFSMTGQNRQGGSYNYFKLEDLIGPVKPFLAKYQCILLLDTQEPQVHSRFEKIQGSKDPVPRDRLVTYAQCVASARIQSISDPEDYVMSNSFGYKVDQTADKALGADTVGVRYALMHMFLAGSEFDPDDDAHDVRSSGLLAGLTGPAPVTAQQVAQQAPAAPSSGLAGLLSSLQS